MKKLILTLLLTTSSFACAGNLPANGQVFITSVVDKPGLADMGLGMLRVRGHLYPFRTGGFGRGMLPPGTYNVTPHRRSRSDRSMSVGGCGYSFALTDIYDPRVGDVRRMLRVHPDGGTNGTQGCLGIVGGKATQKQFLQDMEAAIEAGGGVFVLVVSLR